MTYSILTFGSLPPKSTFYCPICVDGHGVIKSQYRPYSELDCRECDNRRLIADHEVIHKLTTDYCIPEENVWTIDPGSYYTLLLSSAEIKGGITEDLINATNVVNTARFIKDRFFFGTPLDKDFVMAARQLINYIAWIPR